MSRRSRITIHRTQNTEWPDCPHCNSDDVTVVPKTGEWTCQNCGRQWHIDEIDSDDGADIPDLITDMVRTLVEEYSFETVRGEDE